MAENILKTLQDISSLLPEENTINEALGGLTNSPSSAVDIDIFKKITYAELVALRDAHELVPGMQYRITDYETIITGSYDLSVIGTSGYLHNAGVPESHPFDIIVVADDENHLNENARAALHNEDTYFANSNISGWKLKYSLDNDTTKYTWANTNGKGVIWWMEDEWNNKTGYDFKNIRFLRYALKLADAQPDYTPVDTGLVYDALTQPNRYGTMYQIFTALQIYMLAGQYFNPYSFKPGAGLKNQWDYDFIVGENILGTTQFSEPDATYLSTFDADWYYTFDYWDASEREHIDLSLNHISTCSCRENYIELEMDPVKVQLNSSDIIFGLGGSVWEINSIFVNSASDWVSCNENHLGIHNWWNTFGNDSDSNTFGNNCHSNTFGNNCHSNTFGNYCYSNIFGNNSSVNTLRSGCDSNTFRNGCGENIFGEGCHSNIFGSNCYKNTFKNECYSNTFGNYCSRNTFGNDCYSNELQGNIQGLEVKDVVSSITITSTEVGVNSPSIKTLENYDGNTSHATLIVKTGYNTETIISTTDGGTTWS